MTPKQIEVYNYYKKLYPGTLLFFHVENRYVVLQDDAATVAELLKFAGIPSRIEWKDSDLHVLSDLGDAGAKIKLIEYRNIEGKFDFPDIELLIKEKEEDY